MPPSLSPRYVIAALIGTGLIVAGGAWELAIATGNEPGALLRFLVPATVGLILIGFVARLIRRVRVGSPPPFRIESRAMFAWLFTRFALLVAILVLLVGLLTALALDGPVASLIYAIILVTLLSWIVRLSGQIVVNGRLALRAQGDPAPID